jgi:hypothetical protein
MKIPFTLFLFLLPSVFFGQTSIIEPYNNSINKAEIEIAAFNYEKALNNYLEAFKLNKKPLTKDIFNALVCRLYLNDFEKSKVLLFKLAQRGITWESLEKKGIFEISGNQSNWKSFIPFYEQFYEEKKLGDYYNYLIGNLDSLEQKSQNIFYNKMEYLSSNTEGEAQRAVKFRDFIKLRNGVPLDSIKVYSRQEAMLLEEKHELVFAEINNQIQDLLLKIVEIPGFFDSQLMEPNAMNNVVSFYLNQFLGEKNYKKSNPNVLIRKDVAESLRNQILEAYYNIEISPSQMIYWMNHFELLSKIRYTIHHLKVENPQDCEEFDNLNEISFIKKETLSEDEKKFYKSLKSQYFLESIEDKYIKEKYALQYNQYFIFPKFSREEYSVMPSCDAALNIIKDAEILKD